MKNQSDYTLHETDDKGVTHVFGPGDDIPSWVKVDNPYVTGQSEEEESSDEDGNKPDAPRRGRPRKAADES